MVAAMYKLDDAFSGRKQHMSECLDDYGCVKDTSNQKQRFIHVAPNLACPRWLYPSAMAASSRVAEARLLK
jgi:hypothetical protein